MKNNTLQLKTINTAKGVLKCEHFDLDFKLVRRSGCEGWHITSVDKGKVKTYGLSRLTKEDAWSVVADMFRASVVIRK